jgi:hypothetical protein
MRDFLEAGVRRFASGWWFWALVLLVLPNCSSFSGAPPAPPHLEAGASEHTSAIMCDIEKYQVAGRRCATSQDLGLGIPLTMAAEKLVTGELSYVGLDYSPAAQAACGAGIPQAIDFQGPFPNGLPVCLNCGVIPTPYADATAVCVAQCQDLIVNAGGPMPPDVLAFCRATAHPSTLFPTSGCFENACSNGGTLRSDFTDPRRIPEAVVWRDFIGTAAAGSSLTRTAPTTGETTADFNAGAVSTQWIHGNDGYIEIEAGETNLSHLVGLAQVDGGCPFPCADNDPSIMAITFAISLNSDGHFYLLDGGTLVMATDVNGKAPDVNGSFGTYSAGDRFRISVKDNFGGTATVTFSRIAAGCVPGHRCLETVFYTHGGSAAYPLRVDTSYRERNATLANVSIVRIQ